MDAYEDVDYENMAKQVLGQQAARARRSLEYAAEVATILLNPKKGFDGGFYSGTVEREGYKVTIIVEKIHN